MKKKLFLSILGCLLFLVADAQIGYQVALLNSATGEPRANETVRAEVTITDSNNGTVYSGTQSVTSNDFGILSFTVGNANTFKDLGTRKLPLYISVTVNGTLIGKSQILSVPVAEVANTLKSDFTLDELCGKEWDIWSKKEEPDNHYHSIYKFNKDGTFVYKRITNPHYWYGEFYPGSTDTYSGTYDIVGNQIYVYFEEDNYSSYYIKYYMIRWRNGSFDFRDLPGHWGK